jgi:catechol 2,3-dioxygenase-like lactoylglutathione lyase family enzyme
MAVEVRAFSHVGITVTDVDRSVAFYTEVLGFRVRWHDEHDGWRRVGLAVDSMSLELFSSHPTGQTIDPVDILYPAPYGRPKIALTVADIDAAYAEVIERSVPNLGPVTVTGVSRIFFVLDPDGTLIQLHQFDAGYERVAELFDT